MFHTFLQYPVLRKSILPSCGPYSSCLFIMVFIVLLLPALAWAEMRELKVDGKVPAQYVAETQGKSWAVIMGVDIYQNLPRLPYAVADAKAITRVLARQGFQVTPLYNKQATRKSIIRELGQNLVRRVGKEDRVIIFFAGHGITENIEKGHPMGYMMPVDADPSLLAETSISMALIRELSDAIPAKQVLFLIDICYGDIDGRSLRSLAPMTKDYLEVITGEPARQLITAGGTGQKPLVGPEWKHSVFTFYLLEGLGKGHGDLNRDGIIPASELFAFLDEHVQSAALRHNHAQRPEMWSLTADHGEFIFIPEKTSNRLQVVQIPSNTGTVGNPEAGTIETFVSLLKKLGNPFGVFDKKTSSANKKGQNGSQEKPVGGDQIALEAKRKNLEIQRQKLLKEQQQQEKKRQAQLAAEEAQRQQALAQQEEARLAQLAEAQRIAAEAEEQRRLVAEQARQEQAALKAEQARVAAEEAQRQQALAQQEQERQAQLAEARRMAAAEEQRRQVAAKQAALKAEQARVAAEEEQRQQALAQQEQERLAQLAEAQRVTAEAEEEQRQQVVSANAADEITDDQQSTEEDSGFFGFFSKIFQDKNASIESNVQASPPEIGIIEIPVFAPTNEVNVPNSESNQDVENQPEPILEARLRPPDLSKTYSSQVEGKDRSSMVFIPAGEFSMGSDSEQIHSALNVFDGIPFDAFQAEQPQHPVVLNDYYIDQNEVTYRLFSRFIEATGRTPPKFWGDERFHQPDHPVLGVNWHDANAYCTWAGKRLPTEAEWEKAARGTQGFAYPWGNTWDPTHSNTASYWAKESFPSIEKWAKWMQKALEDGDAGPLEVGKFSSGVSPYGLHDMAGNVSEWVADWYTPYNPQPTLVHNPTGQDSGKMKVHRGGSWSVSSIFARSSYRARENPEKGSPYIGMRCAKTSE